MGNQYSRLAFPALSRLPRLRIATALFALCLSATTFAANPFITSIYTADPSAHVWADGRLYVYPSHDVDPPRGSDLMDRYHVFSTADMVNWRDEGEILRASQIDWGLPQGGFMWAPDCACRNGKYYFYFPHPSGTNWNDTWKIGVATSVSPVSGFTPAGYIQGVGGFSMIDPAVFTDTDGQSYLYYGGGGNCAGVKLKPNMVEIDGAVQAMTNLVDFHEATWVFKRNGIYYLTYADNYPGSNRMRYATSPGPLGPWTSQGIYLNPVSSDTTHGSVVQYQGQWYQFYHTADLSGQGNLRSLCVDVLHFDANGNILTLVPTKTGPPAAGPAPAAPTNTIQYGAALATVGNGALIQNDSAAWQNEAVHNLHLAGSFMELDAVDGGALGGRNTLAIHFASADSKPKLQLTVNGADYSYLNTLTTGGWGTYTGDASLTIPLAPGLTNIIRLTGGNGGVNVDYLALTPVPLPPWNAQIQSSAAGSPSHPFSFDIIGDNWPVAVQASSSLLPPAWTSLTTNTIIGGTNHFSDSDSPYHPVRFYRLAAP